MYSLVELLEADVMRVVSEASSADVQSVLSDQTVRVLANAAVCGAVQDTGGRWRWQKLVGRQFRFESSDSIVERLKRGNGN